MRIPSLSCAVALSRERNNATNANSATNGATASSPNASKPASLLELRAQLRAQLARNQSTECDSEKQTELRGAESATANVRRERVLDMFGKHPDLRYAVLASNLGTDPVLATIGIRDVAMFEFAISKAKFDALVLIDLIDHHGGATMH